MWIFRFRILIFYLEERVVLLEAEQIMQGAVIVLGWGGKEKMV